MAKLMTIFIFSTILNGFLITFALSKSHSLNEVINALTNIVEYFKKNYQYLNFEAHFGLRVIEGQLKLLLTDYNDGKHRLTPANMMTQLRYLSGEAAKTANMAVPHLLEYDRHAFSSMRYQVEKPWIASHTHRLINTNLKLNVSANKPKEILEEDRNACIAELTGVNNKDRHKCATTLNCLEMMSAKGQRGFSLQHQIFYTAFAEQVGCKNSIEDYLSSLTSKTNLEQLQRELCSNAYYELMKTVEYYGIQSSFVNLFLLMEFNCPSLGFFQFLTEDWLSLILSWQNPNGCISGNNEQVTVAVNTHFKKLPSRLIVQQEYPNAAGQELVQEVYNQNLNRLNVVNDVHPDHQLDVGLHNEVNNQPGNINSQHLQENVNLQAAHDKNNFPQENYINNRNENNQEIGFHNEIHNDQQSNLQHLHNNEDSQFAHNMNNFHQQQNAWFPNHNVHLHNLNYANPVHAPHIANGEQFHQHLLLSGSEEIAHHENTLHNNNQNEGHVANGVQEVVHSLNNNNFNSDIKENIPLHQYNTNLNLHNVNNNVKFHNQRNILQVDKEANEGKEDDDHGYSFDREKHIGGNSSEKRVYLYYYPMYEQMKRINDVKERQQLRKAERQKKLHLQRLSSRKLLRDSTGNCNMQLTGLAACALTMYIRFMVDPGPPEFHGLRLNKPEGQYDLGVRESFEEIEPEEQVYVPDKQKNNGLINQDLSALKNVQSYNLKEKLYPIHGGFQPLYFGDVRKKLHPEEDDEYVRKAESPKNLVDKAFESETRVLDKPNGDSDKNFTNIFKKKVINTRNETIFFNSFFISKAAQITAFNKHLPTELVYHLLIIILISIICVCVLFRYLRFKRRVRYRTKYI